MSGTRALLAAILAFCAAATLGGVFARRSLRAERRLRDELLGRYGSEFVLLDELSARLSGGAGALSRGDYATACRALAKPGVLLARLRTRSSPSTFRIDRRLALTGRSVEPAGGGVTVRRTALPLKGGGSLDAVVAAWKVRAPPRREEVVCEFAVEARALQGR